jgi:hypothetical protein
MQACAADRPIERTGSGDQDEAGPNVTPTTCPSFVQIAAASSSRDGQVQVTVSAVQVGWS